MKFKDILLDKIIEGDDQRSEVDEDLIGLSNSIEKYDVLQPILVYPVENGQYRIISGHRRYRAMKARNEATVPCIIRTDLSAKDRPFVSLVENLQRKQLTPGEVVNVFNQLKEADPTITNRKIALLIGKSTTWVTSQYKYVEIYDALIGEGIPEDVLDSLSLSVIRNLRKVNNPKEKKEIAKKVKENPSEKERIEIIKKAVSFEPINKRELDLDERLFNELVSSINVYDAGKSGVLITFKDDYVKNRFLREAWDYRRIDLLQRLLPFWANDRLNQLKNFVRAVADSGECEDAEFILNELDSILHEGDKYYREQEEDITKRICPLDEFVPEVHI